MDIYLNTTAPLWAKSFVQYARMRQFPLSPPPACVVYFYFSMESLPFETNKPDNNKKIKTKEPTTKVWENTPYRRHVLLRESTFCPSLETWGYS